jgi:tRNA (guanine-N7-)-methyltransferase
MEHPQPPSLHYGINPRLDGTKQLDFTAIFGNDHEIVLEIGSGKGRFLVDSAKENPALNYVGIEKSLHYYRVIEDRLKRHALANARIVNDDAFHVLRDMIAPKSVGQVHIYFPDPWPRPRERKRRMIRNEVLLQIERILRDDGWGIYVTDHAEYFQKALPVLEEVFEVESEVGVQRQPRTNYEAKYLVAGRTIHEARFRKRR